MEIPHEVRRCKRTEDLVDYLQSPYLWAATPSCEGCKVAPEIKRYDMGTSQSYVRANWTVASYSYGEHLKLYEAQKIGGLIEPAWPDL